MANYNKNKGKAFERELAKHLTGVFGLNFQRVPNSGAFVGGKNAFRRQTLTQSQELLCTGDLIVPDELRHVSIECKFYKDFSFVSLFSENKLIDSWIQQASSSEKLWFLAFKINNCGVHIVYARELGQSLALPQNHLLYKNKYVVTSMDSFFETNKDAILNWISPVEPRIVPAES